MIRRAFNAPITWFVLLVVVAVAVTTLRAEGEAATNYENQIASCEAGNPVREAVVLAVSTAAQVATKGNARYAEAEQKILNAPYVKKTGARNCQRAVQQP